MAELGPMEPLARTVLVVDDQEDILESLKDLLETSLDGVEVRTALSGKEALGILERERIDLIVTDYKMPGMDGLEFLEASRTPAPKTPRILMTAFPDLELAIKAINEARIENFFTKPLDPHEIIKVVEDTLERVRSQIQREQAFSRAMDIARANKERQPPSGGTGGGLE